jgi:hypothetical protein
MFWPDIWLEIDTAQSLENLVCPGRQEQVQRCHRSGAARAYCDRILRFGVIEAPLGDSSTKALRSYGISDASADAVRS